MPNPFVSYKGNISLYLHIPFCENKCPYCAFDSFVYDNHDAEMYLDLLEKELLWWTSRMGKMTVETCYIGGGTPTTLTSPQWIRLTNILDKHFDYIDNAEVTVEANPNTLKADHLLNWNDWRVSRVSIGVQSFDDTELRQLGRTHTSAQAYNAISATLASSFSVSIDLMFGLPGQTFQNWARTLKQASLSGTHHLSLYQLTYEPNSKWQDISSDTLSDGYYPYRWAQWYLPHKGFEQYEVANFSKLQKESKHNINYWRNGEYLGVGLSASGHLSDWRYKNTNSLSNYEKLLNSGKSTICSGEKLSFEAKARETFILSLRMNKGLQRKEYIEKFGSEIEDKLIQMLFQLPKDLYEITESNIKLTPKGMRVANMIWAELI